MKTVCMLLAVLLLGASAYAGCRVHKGDTKQEVLEKCGPPQFTNVVDVDTMDDWSIVKEAWHYNGKVIVFRGKKVVKIKD